MVNDVDGVECETSLVAKTPEAGQHFFLFLIPGFIGCANKWQVFFSKILKSLPPTNAAAAGSGTCPVHPAVGEFVSPTQFLPSFLLNKGNWAVTIQPHRKTHS